MPRSRNLTNEEHDAKARAVAEYAAKMQAMDVLRKHPLARNAQTPSEVFQYLISILTAKPVMKVYSRPTLDFKDQREANAVEMSTIHPSATEKDFENIINYSELLIVRLAMLIHTEIMVTAELGREVELVNNPRRIKVKLYGSHLIESEEFTKCLSDLVDLDAVYKAVHTVFVDLASHQHPITQDPLSELLKSMATTRIHGAEHTKPIKSNRTLCFDDNITIQSITDQMVLTLFVGHLLTEICLVLLPTTFIAIKLHESHIDFIASSKYDAGISFVPAHNENTVRYHAKYACFDSRDEPESKGVIGVTANGMFDAEKLGMILAQHNQCSRVDIMGWEEIKDKAAYDAYNA